MLEIFSTNVKYLRRKLGLTQGEVEALINKGHGVLNTYESGKTQPPYDILIKLAALFQVSVDELLSVNLEKTPPPNVYEPAAAYTRLPISIPLYTIDVFAGDTTTPDSVEEVEGYLQLPDLPLGNCCAVRVQGDSMLPTLTDRDLVVCLPVEPHDFQDDLVYLIVARHMAPTIKRVRRIATSPDTYLLELSSDNQIPPPRQIAPEDLLKLYQIIRRITTHHLR